MDISSARTNESGKLTSLPEAVRAGYDFEGWYTDPENGEKITADHIFTEDTVIYAHWKRSVMLGDLNGDNKVNAIDAKLVLQYVSGSRKLTDEQEAAADVNGDGVINAVDAKWILQTASGSRTLK